MELEIKHTNVFTRVLDAINDNNRYVICVGGSRSSKNISIIQIAIYLCYTQPGTIFSVIRTSMPLLKKTAIKDFVKHMNKMGIYDSKKHNLTEQTYSFSNGSEIKFLSTEDLKGVEHHYAYINEADEVDYDDFTEIKIRTTKAIIIDYNPSESEHWTYHLRSHEKAIVIHSTYKDNVFLSKAQISEIEGLIESDERAYKIYALGEYPAKEEKIFNHYKLISEIPQHVKDKNIFCYGLDFGWSDPSALVRVWRYEKEFYVEQVFYETQKDSDMLIELFEQHNIEKNKPILCDWRPDIVNQLRKAGYNATASKKGPGSIDEGINFIRINKLFITTESSDLKKEMVTYSYKINKSTGKITDEPVDFNNHAIDAMRYGAMYFKNKGAGFSTTVMTFDY